VAAGYRLRRGERGYQHGTRIVAKRSALNFSDSYEVTSKFSCFAGEFSLQFYAILRTHDTGLASVVK
jgi:hypothetical protein